MHFPKSCLHCDEAACVTVCPTGASYKRSEDGIVLVDEDLCIGCGLCAWACPYGARELDADQGVMKKCTLCIDRIYNENLPEADRRPACVACCPTGARHFGDLADPDSAVSRLVAERGGFGPMPELGYQPTNRYLPPRPRRTEAGARRARGPRAGRAHRRLSGLAGPRAVGLSRCIRQPRSSSSRRSRVRAMGCCSSSPSAALFGLIPALAGLGPVGMALALGLVSVGLLSSTLHLGHPERAWRAVSQWRSSWLSREGVMALITYLPALIFASGWVLFGTTGGIFWLFALLGGGRRRRRPSGAPA